MINDRGDLIDVKLIAQGDAAAFTRVYNLYAERVYGFAHRMLGSPEIAEDITHEAFMVIIQYPERYSPERGGSMLTFLCSIARNQIFHHFRRHGFQTEESFDEDLAPASKAEDQPDPLGVLLEQELAKKVNEAIAGLPAFQREVIILRQFQELSYEEIAIVASVELNVVKARLHRARQNLAKKLAPYMISKGEQCYEL